MEQTQILMKASLTMMNAKGLLTFKGFFLNTGINSANILLKRGTLNKNKLYSFCTQFATNSHKLCCEFTSRMNELQKTKGVCKLLGNSLNLQQTGLQKFIRSFPHICKFYTYSIKDFKLRKEQ